MNEALASMETEVCTSPTIFWVPQFLHVKMALQDEMNQEGTDHQRLCIHAGAALHTGGRPSLPKHPIQQSPHLWGIRSNPPWMLETTDSTKPSLYCVITYT